MLILGLCASPRPQGNTRRLLDFFLQCCAEQGAQTKLLGAWEYRVDFCRACEQCMRDGTCPLPDDYLPLLPELLKADAIVLATPNYAFDLSAQMKAVMDRGHALLYYSQALRGKYGVGLCVGGHWARTKAIARWCGQAIWLCGGVHVGQVWGVSKHRDKKGFVHETRVHARARRVAGKLMQALAQQRHYPGQAWLRETFLVSGLRRMFGRRQQEYPYVAEKLGVSTRFPKP